MSALRSVASTIVLTYSVHSVVACLLALVGRRLLSRPRDRDIVWKTALLAPIVTTALSLTIASTTNSLPAIDIANTARALSRHVLPAREVQMRMLLTENGTSESRIVKDPVASYIDVCVVCIALVSTSLGVIRFAYRRRALSVALAGRHSARNLDVRVGGHALTMWEVDGLASPIALGRAAIALPTHVAREFSKAQQAALIRHEVAHLERRDPYWFVVVELITAVAAFQPMLSVVARVFRRDVELICDEAALKETHDRVALIGALTAIAAPFDPCSPLVGVPTAYNGSPLVARANRIATVALEQDARGIHQPFLLAATLFAAAAAIVAIPTVATVGRITPPSPALIAAVAGDTSFHGRRVLVDTTAAGVVRRRVVMIR